MDFRITLLIIAMSMPSPVFAQMYKCTRTDGSVSFQDHPCAIGSVGTQVTLQPVTGPYVEPENASTENTSTENTSRKRAIKPKVLVPGDGSQDYQRRLADEQIKAQNEQINAHNRMVRCNHARQQLGVLKESRPVYSYDAKGERVYIEDKDRAAQVSSAERRVAEECN
jgi:hypothetical protein